jgi:hypothetical protein
MPARPASRRRGPARPSRQLHPAFTAGAFCSHGAALLVLAAGRARRQGCP